MMLGRGTPPSESGPRRTLGIHLMPLTGAVDSPRPTVVVELNAARSVTAITTFRDLPPLLDVLAGGPCVVCVDAPFGVANTTGRRPIDELLAWLDVPVFPVSRRRASQVWGGLRGEELRALVKEPSIEMLEAVPDAAMRLIDWETSHASDDVSLERFREQWLSQRPPRYRPKGSGRAIPRGIVEAYSIIGRVVDWAGWHPDAGGTDWAAIADAAIIDATLAADTAWRAEHDTAVIVEWPDSACALGVVPVLAQRIRVNVERLARQGHPIRLRDLTAPAQ